MLDSKHQFGKWTEHHNGCWSCAGSGQPLERERLLSASWAGYSRRRRTSGVGLDRRNPRIRCNARRWVNLRMCIPTLSISAVYPRTLEGRISIALVSRQRGRRKLPMPSTSGDSPFARLSIAFGACRRCMRKTKLIRCHGDAPSTRWTASMARSLAAKRRWSPQTRQKGALVQITSARSNRPVRTPSAQHSVGMTSLNGAIS
ncbi:hypothetical protein ACVMB0_007566 [Bradyrhizobium sp. USDA 4451]